MSEPLKILSLGAGVQSSTVLLMSCVGELPKLDCAIFADTKWESKATYCHLEYLEGRMTAAGIPFYRVSAGDIRANALVSRGRATQAEGQGRFASLPLFTRSLEGGAVGRIKRQCTKEYKIEPIEKKIRELLGLKYRERWPKELVVEQWFGISVDEQARMRLPRPNEQWKTHYYPLVFGLSRAFSRHDCLLWLNERGYPLPPRSACLGCPNHTNREWREIKERPEEWTDVTELDAAIRESRGMRGQTFLHRSCQPLVQIDFSTDEERGQLLQEWREDCATGYCGT